MPTPPVAVTLRFMRDVHRKAVLKCLREEDGFSGVELAKNTGLSRQAVSRVLEELEHKHLIEFIAPDRSTPTSGRPAQTVRFRSEAGYVIGGLIDPQNIQLALADLRGNIVNTQSISLEKNQRRINLLELL